MRWIVIFEDTPAMMEVRAQHDTAHLQFLLDNEQKILIAGDLREPPGGDFVGGLWVLEVPDLEHAMELLKQDPYFVHGARRFELRVWGKAFADKKVGL